MKGKIFFGDGSYGYVIATKDSEIDGKDVIIILIKLDPYFSKKHNLKRFNDKTKDKFFIQDTFKCYYPFENVTHLREL